MGICESSHNSIDNEKEEIFLPGEQYFNKVDDINPNTIPNNSRNRVELFFSLT